MNTTRKVKRTSAACEACRTRRTRCRGGIPCLSCLAHDQADQCQIRPKPRPNRPVSRRARSSAIHSSVESRNRHHEAAPVQNVHIPVNNDPSSSWLPTNVHHPLPVPSALHSTTDIRASSFRPIAHIDETFAAWCILNQPTTLGQSQTNQMAYDHPRLSQTPLPPLDVPQQGAGIEDELMSSFTSSPTIDDLNFVDPARLSSLYGRYKLAPLSVSNDSAALLNACFCMAAFTRMATTIGQDGHPNIQYPQLSKRRDLAYYQESCRLLSCAGQSSIDGLWALQLLTSYAVALGSASEVTTLLDCMSKQVHDMALHREEAVDLYPSADRARKLFYSCFFLDTWYSTITDSPPRLRWGSFDHQLAMTGDLPRAAVDITICESELLLQLHKDNLDTTLPEFVVTAESKLFKLMNNVQLFTAYAPVGATTLILWARVRFHWLWILLRYPCLSHPLLGTGSMPIIMNSIGHILSLYTMLDESSSLNPSWPQLRRIITCGQLLVLCQDQGAAPLADFLRLAELTFALLEKHAETWPVAQDILASLRLAVAHIDITQNPRPASEGESLQPRNLAEPGDRMISHGFGISLESFLTDWQERPWDALWSEG